jgi:hypothetical protein
MNGSRTSGRSAPAATGISVRSSRVRTRSALRVVLASGVAADRRDAQDGQPGRGAASRIASVVVARIAVEDDRPGRPAGGPRQRGEGRGLRCLGRERPASLLLVRPAVRRGARDRPDEPGDHEDRDHVRTISRISDGIGTLSTESRAWSESAKPNTRLARNDPIGVHAPKIDRGQADEPAARGHVPVEPADAPMTVNAPPTPATMPPMTTLM